MGSAMAAGQPQNSPGQSPLDQERDQGPKDREQTPEGPRDGDQPQGQKPEQEQQKPGGDKPESPLDNPLNGDNTEGNPQDPEQGPEVAVDEDAAPWGQLPVRYQEVFRNQGGEDLPVQYRDWIDSYYRRLNKKR